MSRGLARRTDPATSHQAALNLGDTTPLEGRVLDCLRRHGRCSSHDVARLTGLELVTVSPRFAPLERKGLIRMAGRRGRRQLWEVAR